MYEMKITVEIPGLPEAINALASALGKGQPFATFTQNGANNQQIENTGTVNINKPAATKQPAPIQTEAPAEEQTTMAAPAAEAPAATPAPTAEAKSYTVDDLSRAGATLIDQGKMPQLIELLKKYGVQAVTQLDASNYTAFVEEMKALGAQL